MKKFFLTVLIFIALPSISFAWGKKGHAIVAQIAYSLIDKQTKESLQKYLGATTTEAASTWMDELRGNHTYDYMKPWHYVNIEKGGRYVSCKDDNIINALNHAINNLEHKDKLSDEDIKLNLLVIFHLAGDLHQPLHVGYADDKGGNAVHVTYLDRSSNLHTVWDSRIIESEHINTYTCLSLLKGMDKSAVEHLKAINIEQWMQQPRSQLASVYNFENNTLDETYAGRNKAVVEQQLLIAGIRLSALLQHVLKS